MRDTPPATLQAGQSLREVTLTKATVIAPVMDLLETHPAAAPQRRNGLAAANGGRAPPREQMAGAGSRGLAGRSVASKRTVPRTGGQDYRIQMVFDDSERCETSGDHIAAVATQCVARTLQ